MLVLELGNKEPPGFTGGRCRHAVHAAAVISAEGADLIGI
jgi:hypothetical protein